MASTPLSRLTASTRRNGARFLRDESGVMIPHVVIFLTLMLLLGGIAVDVMRFETRRVAVQNTLDRATLAAASLEQDLDPRDVVTDYFTKAGLEDDLERVTVEQGMNFRIVNAAATVISKNLFMQMMNIPQLETENLSQAEQRITNIEIALVLDVSGSMHNTISRIQNLRTAAKSFIDTVLRGDSENKISIAMVPYNGHVNLGPDLYSQFSVSHGHSYPDSYCLDLPPSTFSTLGISRVTTLPQVPFIDAFSATTQENKEVAVTGPTYDSNRKLYSNVWCNPVAGNYVRLHSNRATTLKSQIDGLVAIGATSIELGMKWGTALLDPSAQPITAELAARGLVPAYFADRPAPYEDEETMKIIVLMTDGENFEQERISDDYRSGSSPIFRATSDGRMSRYDPTKVSRTSSTNICNSRPYWVPHLAAWHSRPWNGSSPKSTDCYSGKEYAAEASAMKGVEHLYWQDVWERARTSWVAWQLYARAIGTSSSTRTSQYNNWMSNFRSLTPVTTMDSRLNEICNTAKASGIRVYGIAFEAPTGGKRAIESCASAPKKDYYFDVRSAGLQDAFAAIASNLSRLRLTQ